MKKLFYVFVIALMGCNSPKQDTFKIEGSIDGLKSRSLIYAKVVNGRPSFLDTIDVSGDKFSYDAPKLEENDFRFLVPIYNQRAYVKMYLDNSAVKVQGNVDTLWNVRVVGSETNDLFNELMKDYAVLSKKAQILSMKIKFEKDPAQKMTFESLLMKNDSDKTVLFIDFADKHPESTLSPWALYQIMKFSDYATVFPVSEKFTKEVKESRYYADLKLILNKLAVTSPGQASPKFSLPDINGKIFSSDDFLGKYVLLNFWSPLCSHCRVENPELVDIYNKYKGDNFDMVGINVDYSHDIEIWELVIKEDKLGFTQLLDTINFADAYMFSRTPYSVLLDKEGKIIAAKLTPAKIEEILGDIFK